MNKIISPIVIFILCGNLNAQISSYSNINSYYDTIKARNDSSKVSIKLHETHFIFPARDTIALKLLYGNSSLSTLQNLNLSIAADRFSIYTELLSDYLELSFFTDPQYVKIGFGSLLSSSDSTQQKDSTADALQRFFGAGGNAMLYVSWAIFNSKEKEFNKNYLRAGFLGKIAADLPAVNSEVDKTTWNLDIGLELSGKFSTISDKFSFFMLSRASIVYGSKDFIHNLGFQDNSKRTFGYINYYIGLDLNTIYRIGISGILAAPGVIKENLSPFLSIQLLPFGGEN